VSEAPPGISRSIKIPSDDDAKILAIWFNSSLNILQTLINRKETREAFLQIDEYTLEDFQVIDPRKLSENDHGLLIRVFDEVKGIDLPCILEQLKTKFQVTTQIDRAELRVLGFGDDEFYRLLDYLYPALADEIQQLRTLMQG